MALDLHENRIKLNEFFRCYFVSITSLNVMCCIHERKHMRAATSKKNDLCLGRCIESIYNKNYYLTSICELMCMIRTIENDGVLCIIMLSLTLLGSTSLCYSTREKKKALPLAALLKAYYTHILLI